MILFWSFPHSSQVLRCSASLLFIDLCVGSQKFECIFYEQVKYYAEVRFVRPNDRIGPDFSFNRFFCFLASVCKAQLRLCVYTCERAKLVFYGRIYDFVFFSACIQLAQINRFTFTCMAGNYLYLCFSITCMTGNYMYLGQRKVWFQ